MKTADCPHCGKPIQLRRVLGPTASFDHDQALALIRFGATTTEVAETFGVTRQRIHQIRKKAGL